MLIIPAIDLKDGKCVRLKQGAMDKVTVFSDDPVKMAELGVKAIVELVKTGKKPANSPGLDFYNTGVELVTDKAADGVKSITTSEASKICWGK